jgi:hypothetical protein
MVVENLASKIQGANEALIENPNRKSKMVINLQSGHGGHDVRERINACRRRLRRSRAAAKSDCGEAGRERPAISIDEQSPVGWIGEGATPKVDRRPSPRARFKREEETVRA